MLNQTEKFLTGLIDASTVSQEQERRRRLYAETGPARPEHDADEVTRALETVRQRIKTVTSGDVPDYVEVPTLSRAHVAELRDQVAAIKRRRTFLNDELAAANLRAHVTVSDDDAAVLRKHGIIE
jgi:hypothetical protein